MEKNKRRTKARRKSKVSNDQITTPIAPLHTYALGYSFFRKKEGFDM